MRRRIAARITYANLAATLAVVLAMGGGALAASRYLINSTRQINPKVLRQLHGRSGPRGVAGPEGPEGHLGPQGQRGLTGNEGPEGLSNLRALPSGASESGVYAVEPGNTSTSGTIGTVIGFDPALEAATSQVVYNDVASNSVHCSGPGHASRGYLCLYSSANEGLVKPPGFLDPESEEQTAGTGRHGVLVRWEVEAAGAFDYGTFTLTAN